MTPTLFIIISVILSLLIAAGINFFLRSTKKFDWSLLFMEGGMPSRHAAIVSSLCTSLYLVERFSTLFVVAAIFSVLVLRDAVGVRHNVDLAVGKLNTLLTKKDRISFVTGHTKIQVVAGIVLGVVVAIVLNLA